jgi:hypothetical protein
VGGGGGGGRPGASASGSPAGVRVPRVGARHQVGETVEGGCQWCGRPCRGLRSVEWRRWGCRGGAARVDVRGCGRPAVVQVQREGVFRPGEREKGVLRIDLQGFQDSQAAACTAASHGGTRQDSTTPEDPTHLFLERVTCGVRYPPIPRKSDR